MCYTNKLALPCLALPLEAAEDWLHGSIRVPHRSRITFQAFLPNCLSFTCDWHFPPSHTQIKLPYPVHQLTFHGNLLYAGAGVNIGQTTAESGLVFHEQLATEMLLIYTRAYEKAVIPLVWDIYIYIYIYTFVLVDQGVLGCAVQTPRYGNVGVFCVEIYGSWLSSRNVK